MHCYKSFNIVISQTSTADSSSGAVRTWGTAGQYYFSLTHKPNNQTSMFELNGFKNTNIYGVSVVGNVSGNPFSANKSAVVLDWGFIIGINGTQPLTSGEKRISPDGFNIYTQGSGLIYNHLSKNTNKIFFSNPITSVKSIIFDLLTAQGIGAEFSNEVSLNYTLTFTFYYDFEGE